MNNNVQLITYVDRFSGGNLNELNKVLSNEFPNLFGGIHLLPFYFPIDGSDAGFDPIDHTKVDSRLGDWNDVKALGSDYDLMADLIVNHMSAQSPEFLDVLEYGRDSEYWDLFLTKESVFPNGMTDKDKSEIYRPRPGSCFTEYTLKTGEVVEFWTTFTSNQIDINVESAAGKAYLQRILQQFSDANIKMIRLDAAGYAIKRPGTKCFMLEDTFHFIETLAQQAKSLGIVTLVEIHSYYKTQIEIAQRVNLVYDFALPPLVLHTLFTKNADALVNWLRIAPRNCVTVLDTHDGIGIIDVGPMDGKPGLLSEDSIDTLVNTIHRKTNGESVKATGEAASNVDLYQVNSSYFAALGYNAKDYLLARAIQFFAPGIPQVYYGGLLAAENDMALLATSNVGRDINRPYLDQDKIKQHKSKSVVAALEKLIRIRNSNLAFDGEFNVSLENSVLLLSWSKEADSAVLKVDLKKLDFSITTASATQKATFTSEDF